MFSTFYRVFYLRTRFVYLSPLNSVFFINITSRIPENISNGIIRGTFVKPCRFFVIQWSSADLWVCHIDTPCSRQCHNRKVKMCTFIITTRLNFTPPIHQDPLIYSSEGKCLSTFAIQSRAEHVTIGAIFTITWRFQFANFFLHLCQLHRVFCSALSLSFLPAIVLIMFPAARICI